MGGGGVLISEGEGGDGQFIVCPSISITQAPIQTAGYGQLLHVIEWQLFLQTKKENDM